MTLNLAKCHACHANSRGDQGARRQSQPSAISATPATQRDCRCRQVPLLPHKVKWRSMSPCATPAAQNRRRCHQAPRLPRQMTLDVAKCHACHTKCRVSVATVLALLSQTGRTSALDAWLARLKLISWWCSLLTRCTIPCACHAKPHLNLQKWSEPLAFLTLWHRSVLRATTACTFSTSQLPKVVRTWCALYILTSKCASRHNGVHFFDVSTSKFVRTWCALYILTSECASRHNGVHFCHILNFQKWSEYGVFCTFWLRNVLRATTACNFSSLIWPAGSGPAALASLLFDPPEPQIIGKTPCFATFLPFRSPASSFFWLFLFSDLLSAALLFSSFTLTASAFYLSILSEVWLLNFLRPSE